MKKREVVAVQRDRTLDGSSDDPLRYQENHQWQIAQVRSTEYRCFFGPTSTEYTVQCVLPQLRTLLRYPVASRPDSELHRLFGGGLK